MAQHEEAGLSRIVQVPLVVIIALIEVIIRLVFVLLVTLVTFAAGKNGLAAGEKFLGSFAVTKSLMKMFGMKY